jgi:hypothetical protein
VHGPLTQLSWNGGGIDAVQTRVVPRGAVKLRMSRSRVPDVVTRTLPKSRPDGRSTMAVGAKLWPQIPSDRAAEHDAVGGERVVEPNHQLTGDEAAGGRRDDPAAGAERTHAAAEIGWIALPPRHSVARGPAMPALWRANDHRGLLTG